MKSTIDTVRESSDLVWELVCALEDGEYVSTAQISQLSEADKTIFTEEHDRITRKWVRECRYGDHERDIESGRLASLRYRNASETMRDGSDVWENAILVRQERAEMSL